jgi:hypothetical protein
MFFAFLIPFFSSDNRYYVNPPLDWKLQLLFPRPAWRMVLVSVKELLCRRLTFALWVIEPCAGLQNIWKFWSRKCVKLTLFGGLFFVFFMPIFEKTALFGAYPYSPKG